MSFWYLSKEHSNALDQEIECPYCHRKDSAWRFTIWFDPPLTDTGPLSTFPNMKFKRKECARQLLGERGNSNTRFSCEGLAPKTYEKIGCGQEFVIERVNTRL